MGTSLREVQLPQMTSVAAIRALTPQGNTPVPMNVMGSMIQLPSGTVKPSVISNEFESVPNPRAIRNNPLDAHLSSV
jgi:hypothetical protein